MIYILHRTNLKQSWSLIEKKFGAEIDIRYHNNDLILHHDPFHHHETNPLITFEDFLKNYRGEGPLILNVKTEGVERQCIDLVNRYKIKNWFFLDLSMPYFVKYANAASNNTIDGFTAENLAVRYSEFEPIEYALAFSGKVKWVWIDCFTKLPLDKDSATKLKAGNFKLCLVSPELQGHNVQHIEVFKKQINVLSSTGLFIDAICTKYPAYWGD